MLVIQLAVAPVIYLIIAALLELGGASFATSPGFVLQVLFVLILLSLAVIGITVFVQTSKSLMSGRARYDPIGRAFQVMTLGAILSEQHAVLGLILTFLSGSIYYLVGFSLVAWTSLVGQAEIHAEFRDPSERMNLASAVRGRTSLLIVLRLGSSLSEVIRVQLVLLLPAISK